MVHKNVGTSAFLAHALCTAAEEGEMFTRADRYGRCSEGLHTSISLFETIWITVGVNSSIGSSLD